MLSSPSSLSGKKASIFAVTAAKTVVSAYALANISKEELALLQAATLSLSPFSKLSQIRQNAQSKSTGQLLVLRSRFADLSRVFTTFSEVNDPLVAAGFALALILNVVLDIQLYSYYGSSGVGVNTTREKTEDASIELKELRELGNGSGRLAAATGTGTDGASAPLCEPASRWLEAPVGTQSPFQRSSTSIQRAATLCGGRKWSRKVD